MFSFSKKILSIFLLLFSLNFYSQDSIVKHRITTVQGSLSEFFIISPKYKEVPAFFPSGAISIKSFTADSLYNAKKKFHFMITMGAAASRYLLSDADFFINFLDKGSMPIYSKRFWGGFGLNYRKPISKKLILDVDVAPCVQIIVDKSLETRIDTASWESKGFEDIYEGLHLYANIKLELKTQSDFAFYFTLSGSFPVLNSFVDNGDEKYHNIFKGQVFAGIGMTYFYKSKHKIERDEKMKDKGLN